MRPLVSIIIPTYNRRPFIKHVIHMFNNQKYPQDRMEMIIIDDGDDNVSDLFKNCQKNIRYYREDTKLQLSDKRNLLNKYAKGDLIMAWDDDDYYSPDYVRVYVAKLEGHPHILLAGMSRIDSYFVNTDQIYRIGPFNNNHCTNTSLCYRREYLKSHEYEKGKDHAEEKYFLEEYKNQMIQITKENLHLALSHDLNTYNREEQKDKNRMYKKTSMKLKNIIKDKKSLKFFKNIKQEIINYKEKLNK